MGSWIGCGLLREIDLLLLDGPGCCSPPLGPCSGVGTPVDTGTRRGHPSESSVVYMVPHMTHSYQQVVIRNDRGCNMTTYLARVFVNACLWWSDKWNSITPGIRTFLA